MNWGELSQAARDAAYNNAAAVANRAALVEERDAESAAYRAAHAGHLDLAYAAGERMQWDIYPAAAGAPCLVFIHGGYWMMNRREDFAVYAAGVAAHGWAVAMPGYPLAPQLGVAGIVAALREAMDWLAAHGAAHGVMGDVVVAGWSAGAQLAAMLLDHERVVAGLGISGVYDLGPLRDTYLNATLALSDEELATCSPLRLPVVGKPMDLAYGSRELAAMVAQSLDFHARRAAGHTAGALVPVAAADHFTVLRALREPDGVLVKAALALVK